MIHASPIAASTLRSLLDRRRFWLMVLLAAAPVLMTLVVTVFADEAVGEPVFRQLIVRTVLPLVALVFGTAALGTELDDGTIVFLLTKPIRRARIVVAKAVVAAGLTAALMVPATLLSGLVANMQHAGLAEASVAYAIAVAAGGSAYALGFMALSTFTTRALAVGLAYVLIWEGILSGLFEGTRVFSVREATLSLASMLQGEDAAAADRIDGVTAVVVLAAVIVGSLALSTWRLARYQLRSSD
jgi:ABC-2 type transport system permease protein